MGKAGFFLWHEVCCVFISMFMRSGKFLVPLVPAAIGLAVFVAPGVVAGEASRELTILFAGDTSFGENYQERRNTNILEERGYDYPLEKLQPFLRGSDFVVANLESPVTDLKKSPFEGSKSYLHWMDVEKAPRHLVKNGITCVSLANNHTLDFGVEGLLQTLEIFKEHDIEYFGAGVDDEEASRPFIKTFEVGDLPFTLAVIGTYEYSKRYDEEFDFYAGEDKPGANLLTAERIQRQIRETKEKHPDAFLVVFPHWNQNYRWKTNRQTALCKEMIDAGADMVIGHGAHMMQEIEKYNDRWIIYGLGNFMFNSPGRFQRLEAPPYSLVASLSVRNNNGGLSKSVKLYPIFSDNRISDYQSRPLTDEEFTEARELLLEKSPGGADLQQAVSSGKDEMGNYLLFEL